MFNNKRKAKKGIVLITTLLIVGLVVMFSTIALVTTMQQSQNTRSFYQREAAFNVAEAGLNYAMMRLGQDPRWSGCEWDTSGTGQFYQHSHVFPGGDQLTVFEHPVSGNNGAVEGRMKIGDYTGTFDLYFVNPQTAYSHMNFVNSETAPKIIPLSTNNNGSSADSNVYYQDGTTWYRTIPGNCVFLVCRGRVGDQTRMVEICLRVGPEGNYGSVAVGRGTIFIDITGNDGKLTLDTAQLNRAPFIRSNDQIVATHSGGGSNDWLSVIAGGGGRSHMAASLTPAPDQFSDTIVGNSGPQDTHLPKLGINDVMPDTTGFKSLKAGTYMIEPDPTNMSKPPEINYYPTTNLDEIYSGAVAPAPTSQLKQIMADGGIVWVPGECQIKVVESMTTETGTDYLGQPMEDVQFISDGFHRLSIKMEADPSDPKYLINNLANGNIYIHGELTGVGTVICKNNIEMEAQSQLDTNTNTGVSVYAGGDVKVNPIGDVPFTVPRTVNMTSSEKHNYLEGIVDEIEDYFWGTGVSSNPDPNSVRPITGDAHLSVNSVKFYYNDPRISHPGQWQAAWPIAKEMGLIRVDESGNEYIFAVRGKTCRAMKVLYGYGKKYDSQVINGVVVNPKDSIFRGLVFACGNFDVNTILHGFALEGGLVAYGGDPYLKSAPSDSGKITIKAKFVDLKYNSEYLSMLHSAEDMEQTNLYWGGFSESEMVEMYDKREKFKDKDRIQDEPAGNPTP